MFQNALVMTLVVFYAWQVGSGSDYFANKLVLVAQ